MQTTSQAVEKKKNIQSKTNWFYLFPGQENSWFKKNTNHQQLPSRGLKYPTLGKGKHLQNAILGGYVSSLEGNFNGRSHDMTHWHSPGQGIQTAQRVWRKMLQVPMAWWQHADTGDEREDVYIHTYIYARKTQKTILYGLVNMRIFV